MALSVDTGFVNANTGSTTTTITVTAQGKAIIMFTTRQNANGSDSANNALWTIGFSDGTNHRSIAWASDDNVATTNCGSTWRTDSALDVLDSGTPTSEARVTGVAFTDATTTTLTWNVNPSVDYLIGFIQVGGSDITNVSVGTGTLVSGSTADVAVTAPGFQPDFAMFIGTQATAAGTITRALGTVGFAASADKEFTMCWGIDDAQNMTTTIDAVSYTNAAASMSQITAGAETIDFLANLKSFDVNGFTLAVTNAASAAWQFGYLVIKGGQWDVGNGTISDPEIISGMAFQPKGLAIANTNAAADATVAISTVTTFGVATSTSTEATVSAGQTDAVLNTATFRATYSDSISSTGTASTKVNFTQFNSDGWQTTSGDARTFGWFACGDAAVTIVSTMWGQRTNEPIFPKRGLNLY